MAVIGGCILVLVAVLVGFSMAGGHVGALLHLSEFVTIGGAAFGALLVMAPKKVLLDLVHSVILVIKGSPYNKAIMIRTATDYFLVAPRRRPRPGTVFFGPRRVRALVRVRWPRTGRLRR